MVFDAHDKALAFFGGACSRETYDYMKTAVETIFVGRDRAYNRMFQMCSHYLVDPPSIGREPMARFRTALHARRGGGGGHVETQVGVIRRRFFVPRPRFKSLATGVPPARRAS